MFITFSFFWLYYNQIKIEKNEKSAFFSYLCHFCKNHFFNLVVVQNYKYIDTFCTFNLGNSSLFAHTDTLTIL